MADFVKDGGTIPHTPGSDITAGDVVVLADKIAVAKFDIASGDDGTLATVGVFNFEATDSTTYTQGTPVYWDDAADEATETASTHSKIGYVYETKTTLATGEETVRCMLVDDVIT